MIAAGAIVVINSRSMLESLRSIVKRTAAYKGTKIMHVTTSTMNSQLKSSWPARSLIETSTFQIKYVLMMITLASKNSSRMAITRRLCTA